MFKRILVVKRHKEGAWGGERRSWFDEDVMWKVGNG